MCPTLFMRVECSTPCSGVRAKHGYILYHRRPRFEPVVAEIPTVKGPHASSDCGGGGVIIWELSLRMKRRVKLSGQEIRRVIPLSSLPNTH
ncbi:uncharacterized protein MYCFIDRAFT_203646 [Pseudocercospora fijiensis CIRAD86]|uniref:Uncharacterized protein n=1 Tax=Pseudocercospora fijiensis (strain CIRAD86) TaxID=383855 RepID=M3AFU2_PSEFD|nr:uncharacterized protein MYCFIDRAFT_203646 [Pseudocercospora fijiensis CIRAD86]EME83461.1 hypothetical protein MYCFIDRAFT_203646 [Pseudocercospora fijiensis CIRAD86]